MKSLQKFHFQWEFMVLWPFCSSILFPQKEREEKNSSRGTNRQQQPLLYLSNWCKSVSEKEEGIQMDKLNKNYGIQWNATNKSITKYENLFGVKSIFESIQRFARYRIVPLIWIGRLCMLLALQCSTLSFSGI